ncbi:MAG: DUF6691 family protein [Pseudomonadota bacterium]
MRLLIAFASGLLFGLGLWVSDMADPARVLGFLDLGALLRGTWDPTLMFVMAGAMAVSGAAWALASTRERAVTGAALPGPASRTLDARLIGGATLFGIGWGLSGVCPGPALTVAGVGGLPILVFLAGLAVGFLAFDLALRPRAAPA